MAKPATKMMGIRTPISLLKQLATAAKAERRTLSAEVILRLEASFKEQRL